ncbi:MAG: polysaccharide deacetylase family protein [Candidatus Buchananbacteria bacterium]
MTDVNKPKIILSFDLEYWHSSKFLEKYLSGNQADTPPLNTVLLEKILSRLGDSAGANATFFVLAELMDRFPDLLKAIKAVGHEIGLHGLNHTPINRLSPAEFENDLNKSKEIFLRVIGEEPKGFRAPNFSINQDNKWAWEILEKNDFIYDSSYFAFSSDPTKPLPTKPYPPLTAGPFLEYPVSTFRQAGINWPISGGFYFRLLPYRIFSYLLKRKAAKNELIVLYFHLMDLDESIPDIKIPRWRKTLKYFGVKRGWDKFNRLLDDFSIESIEQYRMRHGH